MPVRSTVAPGETSSPLVVRAEPVQQRSAERLSALLDAAASVVDDIGIDRITTAMVAERSGASIGTVYRYFPDRVAVLQALRDRAIMRFRILAAQKIQDVHGALWLVAIDAAVSASVEMYRTEPGFKIVHFADKDRAPLVGDEQFETGYFARNLAALLNNEHGMPAGPEAIFHLEVAVEIGDALLARAFSDNPAGDERFITEARRVIHDYLAGIYGDDKVSA